MMITLTCANCGHEMEADAGGCAQLAACGNCGSAVTVPAVKTLAEPAPPPDLNTFLVAGENGRKRRSARNRRLALVCLAVFGSLVAVGAVFSAHWEKEQRRAAILAACDEYDKRVAEEQKARQAVVTEWQRRWNNAAEENLDGEVIQVVSSLTMLIRVRDSIIAVRDPTDAYYTGQRIHFVGKHMGAYEYVTVQGAPAKVRLFYPVNNAAPAITKQGYKYD